MALVDAYVGLGANLGDRRATIAAAVDELAALPATRLVARSADYASAPLGASGPDYVNAVVHLRTDLDANVLLAELQRIEAAHGRRRPFLNAPRTLDLDLLLHGNARSTDLRLMLPHPRLHERAFVLAPLAEIAPALEISGLGSIAALRLAVAAQRVSRLDPLRPSIGEERPPPR